MMTSDGRSNFFVQENALSVTKERRNVYQIGKAIVRIHGTVSRERLEAATERFVRSVENQKRKETDTQSEKADGEMEARP